MAYDFGFTGEDVTKEVAAIDPRCLLAFSTGKDCIAAYIAIRDHFEEIVPFYMYQIPGTLEFIEESLAYYVKPPKARPKRPQPLRGLAETQIQQDVTRHSKT